MKKIIVMLIACCSVCFFAGCSLDNNSQITLQVDKICEEQFKERYASPNTSTNIRLMQCNWVCTGKDTKQIKAICSFEMGSLDKGYTTVNATIFFDYDPITKSVVNVGVKPYVLL